MPPGFVSDLTHHGWYGPNQNGFGHPAALGAGGIPRDLASAGGMADMNGVSQIQRLGDRCHI
jgi:hypothetical protein